MHKTKPAWQNGMVNGLGGKIEQGEGMYDCIVREIKEESALETQKDKWIFVGKVSSDTVSLDVLGYVYEGNLDDAKTVEGEVVEWFKTASLPKNIISNLSWLIPMTIDKIQNQVFDSFSMKFKQDR
jgi:8-oxo-dGTP diphosphatase